MSQKKPRPVMLSNRVIIKPDAAESKTTGGIFIPDTAKTPALKGIVMAVGKGRDKDNPVTVKIGDYVQYEPIGVSKEDIEDIYSEVPAGEYLLMREDSIIRII